MFVGQTLELANEGLWISASRLDSSQNWCCAKAEKKCLKKGTLRVHTLWKESLVIEHLSDVI